MSYGNLYYVTNDGIHYPSSASKSMESSPFPASQLAVVRLSTKDGRRLSCRGARRNGRRR